jgi:4-hydroxybenzoate polyprenyltransferase
VRQFILRILPALQLARVTGAFAAVANVWFIILWTYGHPKMAVVGGPTTPPLTPGAEGPTTGEWSTDALHQLPLPLLLAGACVNAVGLFSFATALNDLLDFRRDQTLHPERPLPSGRLSHDRAITVIVATFGLAILGATPMGITAVLLTLLVAGAILFFNAAGKFVPGVGLVVLGLIYAGQMTIPNLHLRFVIPVWLVMTHALLVAAWVHVLGRRAPGISTRATFFALTGWVFWTAVMFSVGWWRNTGSRGSGGLWPSWVPGYAGIAPLVLAAAFAVLVWRRVHLLGRGPRVAEKIARYGALWLSLYGAAWLFGAGLVWEGWMLSALAVVGILGMTVIRELVALLEQPMGYRR